MRGVLLSSALLSSPLGRCLHPPFSFSRPRAVHVSKRRLSAARACARLSINTRYLPRVESRELAAPTSTIMYLYLYTGMR